jgi:hypothetical protein
LKRSLFTTALRLTIAASLVLTICCSVSAAVIRIRPDGNDANNGSSWALAKRTVQAAIDAAQAGDEVWVAAGTYYENLYLSKPVALYGGFAGHESDREERRPQVWRTVLDGAKRAAVIDLLSYDSQPITTVISGFVIQYGRGHESGGLFIRRTGAVSILDNTFARNEAVNGAGIYCNGTGKTVITRNAFSNNRAINSGGGVCVVAGSGLEVSSNLFLNNEARYGSALYGHTITARVAHNTFLSNGHHGGTVVDLLDSQGWFTGNIAAFSPLGTRVTGSTRPSADRNCYFGNAVDYEGISPGPNDIRADPQFLAPWVGDFHLRPTSPCIDAATNSGILAGDTDLDGRPRIAGGRADIGCFEYDGGPYLIRQIAQAKAIPHAFPIALRDQVVTAAFGDSFYIESQDRTAGLKVRSTASPSPGDLASVAGTLEVQDGELTLVASSATFRTVASATVPEPFCVRGPHLGGGPYF